jgi:hypothetical protein
MDDESVAGDGSPQGQVEAHAPPNNPPENPPAAWPVPASGGEAAPLGAPLDVSPVTVLGGHPDTLDAETPARRRPRVRAQAGRPGEAAASPVRSGRRRRAGVAIATATGVVALAAAPFAVVSPDVRVLGEPASSAAKERPTTEAKKRAENPARTRPVVPAPVPAPSWQPRHSAPPAPARPPHVQLPPSATPPADDSTPATAGKPEGRTPDRHERGQPRTLVRRPSTPAESPAAGRLVVSPRKNAVRTRPRTTPSATAAEHHDTVRTDVTTMSAKAPAGKRTTTPAARAKPSARPSRAPAQTRVVQGTYVLHPGESIATNRMRLALQSDGDLVIRDQDGKVVWSTGTHAPGTHAVFQADGNLVLYSSGNATLWSSRTDGHDGAVLVLQGDGDLVIRQGGTTLWTSGT